MGVLNYIWEHCVEFTYTYLLSSQIPLLGQQPIGFDYTDHLCQNAPLHRNCWGKYNIETDYELVTPDTGVIRQYDYVITNKELAPDGFKRNMMVIDGKYPGPTIEADWGDTIKVTFHNELHNFNGTSIHWHGIRQFHTNWEDGVSGVTQCPIPPESAYTYEFRATQYGVSWYHSHFSLQYPDGIAGALKINGPTSTNYDVDLGPVLITDWIHADAFSLYQQELLGSPPVPASYLMNGKGVYNCTPAQERDRQCVQKEERQVYEFQQGKTYKMSFVNTAVSTQFTFWIDGHNFTIVGTDFVPIHPYATNVVNVAIGQRYDIIVKANATFTHGSNFWIHALPCTAFGVATTIPQNSTLGIIRYDPKSTALPFTPPLNNALGNGCLDKPVSSLTPIVPRQVGKHVNGFSPDDALGVALQGFPDIDNSSSTLKKWILANSSLFLDWKRPTLELVTLNNEKSLPESYAPIVLDYDVGEWVYFLIEGNFTEQDFERYRKEAPVAHPIHLHGHDYCILAQGNTPFNPKNYTALLKNPTRRDVAMLPVNGYLLIAFQVDNPGTWLMHCHIAWHASSGLALQFIEMPKQIAPLVGKAGVLPKFKDNCAKWTKHYDTVNERLNATQDDSGI